MATEPVPQLYMLEGQALELARKYRDDLRTLRLEQDEVKLRIQRVIDSFWYDMHDIMGTDRTGEWVIDVQYYDEFGHIYLRGIAPPKQDKIVGAVDHLFGDTSGDKPGELN